MAETDNSQTDEAAAKAAADAAALAATKAAGEGTTTPETNAERTARLAAEKEAADAASTDGTDKPATDKEADEADANGDTAGNKANADGNEDEGEDDAGDDSSDYDVEVWGSTGDEVGDSVLSLLASTDITPDEAKALMYDAVKAGRVQDIDQAALIEKVGKAKATLVMAGLENVTSKRADAIKQVQDTVYKEAGGSDNWELVRAWAKDGVDEKTRNEYDAMFNKGGAQARFAAQELIAAYNKDPKTTSFSGKTVTGDSAGKSTVKGMSRREYGDALLKAHNRGASAKDIEALKQRRAVGRQQGL